MSANASPPLSTRAAILCFAAALVLMQIVAPAIESFDFLHQRVRDSLIGASPIVVLFLYGAVRARGPSATAPKSSWDWVAGGALTSLLVFVWAQTFSFASALAVMQSFDASGLGPAPLAAFDAAGVIVTGTAALFGSLVAGALLSNRVSRPTLAVLLMALLFVFLNLSLSFAFDTPLMDDGAREPLQAESSLVHATIALGTTIVALALAGTVGVFVGRIRT